MAQKENPNLSEAPGSATTLYQYMVTIKPTYGGYINQVKKTSLFLVEFVVTWLSKNKLIIIEDVFEHDSMGLMHYHARLTAPEKLNYKKMMEKGWHIYIKQIFTPLDEKKVTQYLQKTKRQIKQQIQKEYSFIEENPNQNNINKNKNQPIESFIKRSKIQEEQCSAPVQ